VGNPADTWLLTPIRRLGRIPLSVVGDVGRMGMFLVQALFHTFAPPLKFFRVLEQIRFIGFGSMLVIVLTGAFTGMVLGFQGYTL
jgi:phospholipid/cholesterol/gamma-HCH transport system permease protein